MRTQLTGRQFDEERALYHVEKTDVISCTFAGPADGESALKEARDIVVKDSSFSLRYPLWHVRGFTLDHVSMDDRTRAALWYSDDGVISSSKLNGIKAVRECGNITIQDSSVDSAEFGWKSHDITLEDTEINSEYIFFDSRNIHLRNVHMSGKYSFQYVENLTIEDSILDTKDAFWHAKNVVVRNSTVKGEYLAWYSDGLTLINCRIIGTQPLCYCENLKLIDCTMEGTDLSFEYSDVQADIKGHIDSVKNPRSGVIAADSIGEIIRDNPVYPCTGEVIIR